MGAKPFSSAKACRAFASLRKTAIVSILARSGGNSGNSDNFVFMSKIYHILPTLSIDVQFFVFFTHNVFAGISPNVFYTP
jgi:hypothetical protein